jgi:cytidylate kinase
LNLTSGPGRAFLLAGVVLCAAGASFAQTETTPSSSTPGQAIPGTGGVSPFAGSVPAKLVPGVMALSLQDAVDRGLKQNLGLLLSNADIRSASGQRWEQLSALLPHVMAEPYVADSKINLAELGFTSIGGIQIPPSVGPFSYFDARVAVTQSLFDWKSINAARAASQNVKSAEYTNKDARDLVVLAESILKIIVGRGSQHFLGNRPDTLRVFLYAPRENKVRRLLARGKSENEALQLVDIVDHERHDFIQKYFHVEWPDRALYHAMINTAIGDDAVVHMILDFMNTVDAVVSRTAS